LIGGQRRGDCAKREAEHYRGKQQNKAKSGHSNS
jgi:hypothetical protein